MNNKFFEFYFILYSLESFVVTCYCKKNRQKVINDEK